MTTQATATDKNTSSSSKTFQKGQTLRLNLAIPHTKKKTVRNKNYERFCTLDRWSNIITFFFIGVFFGVEFCRYYFGIDVVAVVVIIQEYAGSLFDKFKGGQPLDPVDFANFWKWNLFKY